MVLLLTHDEAIGLEQAASEFKTASIYPLFLKVLACLRCFESEVCTGHSWSFGRFISEAHTWPDGIPSPELWNYLDTLLLNILHRKAEKRRSLIYGEDAGL